METIGYAARIACYNDTSKLGSYVIQQMFILLPPVLFAASIYMMLGRIIVALNGEAYSPIRTSRLTKTFVIGDIVAFYIQGGGGGLTAIGTKSTGKGINFAVLGQWIVIGGLVVQILIFGLFCVTAYRFHMQFVASVVLPVWKDWKRMMMILYVVSGLIMIRSLFRVIEFAAGADGYLMTHEWPLYVFDTILMFLVLLVLYFYHPCRIPGLVIGMNSRVRVASIEQTLNPDLGYHNSYQLEEQRVSSVRN